MSVYINNSTGFDGSGNENSYVGEEGQECPLLKPDILDIVNAIKKNPLYADSWDQIKKNYQSNTAKNEKYMQDIIDKRNELVKLIQKDFCGKCNFNISGSTSLTSDIDITVLNTSETKSNHLFAFKEIKNMVQTMKCLFDNKESLLTLDINFYGHSFFFGENLAGLCKQYKKEQEFFLPLDEKMEKQFRFCEGFALLKIKKYYEENKNLKKKWKLNFDLCKKLITNFQNEFSYSGDKNNLFSYVNHDENISEKNENYLHQLEFIDELSHNDRNIPRDILKYMLITEISHASLYSDESYFSYGAFMHIVYGDQMQRDISKILPRMIYIQSMLDNFGDIVKVFNHTDVEHPLTLFSKGSKYIVRIYSAIIAYSSKKYKKLYGNILNVFNTIRELYKKNPEDPEIFILVKKSGLTLDDIKNHVYGVYEDYLNENNLSTGLSTGLRRSSRIKTSQRSRRSNTNIKKVIRKSRKS
jgi:hypothetical protein